MHLMDITGRHIAAARTLAGLTQSELAALAEVSVRALSDVERDHGGAGKRGVRTAVVAALDARGVTIGPLPGGGVMVAMTG